MSASTPSFGGFLRRLRLAAGLTQEGLAELAGISARGVQDLERGVIATPRAETVRLLADALGLDPIARAELIAAAHPELSSPQPPASPLRIGALSAPPTVLVGREQEVATAGAVLRDADAVHGTRLLTLTGPGGVGKTRVALAVAATLADAFPAGVAWVDLAPVRDPDLVPHIIAQSLGLQETGDQAPLATLQAALAPHRLLLVLDNVEHLLPAAPRIAELLAAAPHSAVLATSRARLRLRGERELPIAPLLVPPVPENAAALAQVAESAAVRLFIARAREVRPDFALEPSNAAVVADICRRLDGLPLALELAAAWLKTLPPAALLARLERRLPLLTSGPRDLPARQRTMRAAITWSLDLLTEGEQALFRRIAVFTGSFSLEAVESVAGGIAPGEETTLDLLAALSDHSLVRAVEQSTDDARLLLLETVREEGLERLIASGEEPALRRAHGEYYLALAEQAEPELTGPEQALWLDRLDLDHPNLRAVLEWCTTPTGDGELGLRLACALWSFWEVRGSLGEGRRWLADLLARVPQPSALRARGLNAAGALAFDQGDYAAARALYEESLAIRRELDDARGIAVSLGNLGNVAGNQGDFAIARDYHEECLRIMRTLGEQTSVGIVLNNLGQLAIRQGDYAAARRFHAESLVISQELGDIWGIAAVRNNLGEVALHEGDDATARVQFEAALAGMRDLRDTRSIAAVLNNLGQVTRRAGDVAAARLIFEESLALAREVGDRPALAVALTSLAATLRERDGVAARDLYIESLAIRRAMHDRQGIASCLLGLAVVAQTSAQPERAARLAGAAEGLLRAIGASATPADQADTERTLTAARSALGEERYAAAYAAGLALSLEQALAEAAT